MEVAFFTDLFKGLSLEESIPLIAEAGYHHIEINSLPYWSPQLDLSSIDYDRLDNIKTLLHKHDMSVIGVASFTDIAALNNVEREKAVTYCKHTILAAEYLGCHLTTSMFAGNSIMPVEEQETSLIKSLTELSAFSKQHNTQLALELYPGSYIDSTTAAIAFLDSHSFDNIGYLFCLSHIAEDNEDILDSFELAKNKIIHFHFSDTQVGVPGHSHLSLGKGSINIEALIQKISKTRYDGYFTIQIYSEMGDLVGIAAENRIYLESLIKKYE